MNNRRIMILGLGTLNLELVAQLAAMCACQSTGHVIVVGRGLAQPEDDISLRDIRSIVPELVLPVRKIPNRNRELVLLRKANFRRGPRGNQFQLSQQRQRRENRLLGKAKARVGRRNGSKK